MYDVRLFYRKYEYDEVLQSYRTEIITEYYPSVYEPPRINATEHLVLITFGVTDDYNKYTVFYELVIRQEDFMQLQIVDNSQTERKEQPYG